MREKQQVRSGSEGEWQKEKSKKFPAYTFSILSPLGLKILLISYRGRKELPKLMRYCIHTNCSIV